MKKHPEKLTVNQQTKTGRHKISDRFEDCYRIFI